VLIDTLFSTNSLVNHDIEDRMLAMYIGDTDNMREDQHEGTVNLV
jgi:hypothetical protein